MRIALSCLLASFWLMVGCLSAAAPASAQSQDLERQIQQLEQFFEAGKFAEAEQLARRIQKPARDRLGAQSERYAGVLDRLASSQFELKKFAEAEAVYREVMAIHARRLPPDEPENAVYAANVVLAVIRQMNRGADKTQEFVDLSNRIGTLIGPGQIPMSGVLALALREIGDKIMQFRNYNQALFFLARAQFLYKSFNPTHEPSLLKTTHDLGVTYRQLGALEEAENQLKQALELARRLQDKDSIAGVLHDLGNVMAGRGKFEDSIELYQASQRERGTMSIQTLHNLANSYMATRRYHDAERTFLEEYKLLAAESPRNEEKIAVNRTDLGGTYRMSGRPKDAIPLFESALQSARSRKDIVHQLSAAISLVSAYNDVGRRADALALLDRTRADHAAYRTSGATPSDHPFHQGQLSQLGKQYLDAGAPREGHALLREAMAIAVARYTARGPDEAVVERVVGAQQQGTFTQAIDLTEATFALASVDPSRERDLMQEGFTAMQWDEVGAAGAALTQLGSRAAAGNARLGQLARTLQELSQQWQKLDGELLAAQRSGGDTAALAGQVRDAKAQLSTAAAQISRDYPAYWELVRPQPLTIARVQQLLRDDEVLLTYTVSYKETYAWAISRSQAAWRRIDLSRAKLREHVEALRCGLDIASWAEEIADDCARRVGQRPRLEAVGNRHAQVLPFDADRAHALHDQLIAPFAGLLNTPEGRPRHLLLVLSGPLTSLPFNVLLTAKAESRFPLRLADYRGLSWLGTFRPISVLPTVGALSTLRVSVKPSRASRKFLGVGNPLLDGQQSDPRLGARDKQKALLAAARQSCPGTLQIAQTQDETRRSRPPGLTGLFRGEQADVERLREWSPLPETADELCAVGGQLGARGDDILLGERATESRIKQLSENGQLSQYATLHFATHGALAGQISGSTEPGLLMTPPRSGTDPQALARDDGYLSASEIAGLRLDADWVILSACNTAGGAGESAEALSGIARAFLYAGARALLVSHWEVFSQASVKLATRMFAEMGGASKLNRAEAFRRSMSDMVSAGEVWEAHPSRWAAYTIVGEGAGR